MNYCDVEIRGGSADNFDTWVQWLIKSIPMRKQAT